MTQTTYGSSVIMRTDQTKDTSCSLNTPSGLLIKNELTALSTPGDNT